MPRQFDKKKIICDNKLCHREKKHTLSNCKRYKPCKNCKYYGHLERECRNNICLNKKCKRENRKKHYWSACPRNIPCLNCNHVGHFPNECPIKQNNAKKNSLSTTSFLKELDFYLNQNSKIECILCNRKHNLTNCPSWCNNIYCYQENNIHKILNCPRIQAKCELCFEDYHFGKECPFNNYLCRSCSSLHLAIECPNNI
jgi:hypothetical protein